MPKRNKPESAGIPGGTHPLTAAIQAAAAATAKAEKPQETPQERRQRINELRQARKLQDEIDGESALRKTLEELVRQVTPQFPPPPPYRAPRSIPKTASRETMVQHFSDWHSYEIVDSEKTRGINEFNARVLGQRVRRIVESHLSIKERLERGGGWYFERLVVGANGDMVPGTIHELEKNTDAPNIVMAVYGTGLMLAQALRDLAAQYPEVDVYCTSGNHGRLPDARKVQTKEPTRSWDTMVYLFAREHLRAVPNIKWHIPNSWSKRFNVYKWGFFQTHGHFIKSFFSIPYYGMERMTRNTTSLESVRGWTPNYFLTGHFHTASELNAPAGKVLMNGSLVGANEYVIDGMGKAELPAQHMFGVHPEHGLTHLWELTADVRPGDPMYDAKPWTELDS